MAVKGSNDEDGAQAPALLMPCERAGVGKEKTEYHECNDDDETDESKE